MSQTLEYQMTGESASRRTAITTVRFTLLSTAPPLVTETLPIAERVRRALIRNRIDTPHSLAMTGKTEDGIPLAGHRHAFYLPADEDGDGRIDSVTVHASGGLDPHDVRALCALTSLFGQGASRIGLRLEEIGDRESVAAGGLFASACRWRSATPFSLPRYATRGAGRRPGPRDLPEGQLRRELALRGLPEPVRVEPLEGVATAAGFVKWEQFAHVRSNGTRGHGLAGFEIEFPEPVAGPVVTGFGSHFGLGLFIPAP